MIDTTHTRFDGPAEGALSDAEFAAQGEALISRMVAAGFTEDQARTMIAVA